MTDGSKPDRVAQLRGHEETAWRVLTLFRGIASISEGGVLQAALETAALAVHLQDVDVMSEEVQQR